MSTGATPRWPGPAEGIGLGERVAAGLMVGVVGLAVVGWLTTAVAAAMFGSGSAPGLGEVASALVRLPGHLSDPREAFAPARRGGLPGPAGFYAAAVIVLALTVAMGLGLLRVIRWVRDAGVFAVAPTDRGDGARWARRGDLRALVVPAPQPGRVTLGCAHGRLLAAEPRQSAIVIAPTQSLKTTGLAVPAILEWDGPVLATSVKTDLLRDTIDRRRQVGDVLVFDPTEATGLDGASWSPLVDCTTWHGAQRTAAALCSAAQPGAGLADADFWYAAAAKLLAPVLLAAATVEAGSMADIVRWVDTQEVDEVRDALEEFGDEDALRAARATWARDERQRSSIYTTAETVLAAYVDPRVLAAAYDPEPLADRLLDGTSSTVYVCAPAHEQARLRPLLATLVEQTIAAVYERATRTGQPLDPPLLLVLDEAANVAPLPSLDTVAATAAGQGIQLVSVFQDVAQIRERWGIRAATIVNNHRAKLIGSGIADPETLDFAARILGDQEVRQHSTTAGQEGRASTTESTAYRSLAPPHALRQAEHGTAVLVYGNLPPARVRLRPWFADRDLRRLAGRAPT